MTQYKIGESGRGTLGTQCIVRIQINIYNTQYEDKQTYTIHSTKTKHIHNTQYEDKHTYTINCTKTNTNTNYIVRRQTNIHKTTQKTEHMSNTARNKTKGNQE